MNYILDIDSLVAHMQEQLSSLQSMNKILDRQEEAVKDGDTELVLQTVSQLKGELVERVRLEERRERFMAQWAGELGCSPEEVTVSRISSLDPQRKEQLESLSQQLHQVALQVQTKQEYCKVLMRSELKFVSHLVDALYPGHTSGAYTPGDNLPQVRPALSLDVRG